MTADTIWLNQKARWIFKFCEKRPLSRPFFMSERPPYVPNVLAVFWKLWHLAAQVLKCPHLSLEKRGGSTRSGRPLSCVLYRQKIGWNLKKIHIKKQTEKTQLLLSWYYYSHIISKANEACDWHSISLIREKLFCWEVVNSIARIEGQIDPLSFSLLITYSF